MAQIGTNLEIATRLLKQNKTIAIPTETVYGLAGNALKTEAVVQIFKIKNRPSFDPLIVHVANIKEVEKIAQNIPDSFFKIAKELSPGPVTYILEKKSNIPDLVTAGNPTIGVRIPNHPVTLELLNRLNFPLAAPSANPFGFVSPTSAEHVNLQLGKYLEYILDGGDCEVGIESTIIDLTQEKPRILRLGGLTLDKIESILGEPISDIKTSSSNPSAPGMLVSHYSPGCPVIIGDINKLVAESKYKSIGVLDFNQSYTLDKTVKIFDLSPKADLAQAAKNLFKGLRFFSNKVDVLYTNYIPEKGLGMAINDRLKRASTKVVSA